MLRVAVIEDDPRYRATLETFLHHAPGLELAASFGAAEPALEAVRDAARAGPAAAWDLALMDLELPGIDGIEATRRLKTALPGLAVVVLTAFEDPEVILRAILAGADGYVLKKSGARELADQLRAVAGGGSPLTAAVARKVLDIVRTHGAELATGDRDGAAPARLELTERERDVLRCLVRGMRYQQAADELGVSLDTIRTHIRGIYRKLQVHTVAEAVSRALQDHLL
jgi:DNA-binding NarL/FixJ family response regulator